MKNYDLYIEKMKELLCQKQFCRQSMNSHTQCYQMYREFLIANNLFYCSDSVDCWLEFIKVTENRQIYYAYWNYMKQLAELVSTGTISNEHLSLVTSFYDKLDGTLKTELDMSLIANLQV